MKKHKIFSIVILIVLISLSVISFSGCEALQGIADKFRDTTVYKFLEDEKNSMSVLFNRTKKTATLYGYYYSDYETLVCEIPPQLEDQGEMYTVTRIAILTDMFGGTSDANFTNTRMKEIVIPSTLTEGFSIVDSCLNSLERITISGNNSNYVSVDGVLFSNDKTSLVYYPKGKTDSSFLIPKEMGWFGQSLFRNEYLESITVEQGSQLYRSRDGVLYSADGTVLRCYPRGKTDGQFLIPKEMERVADEYSIYYNQYLESITVEQGSQSFSSRDGVLYSADETLLICYPAGKKGTHFVVPNYVAAIGTKAFAHVVTYGIVDKLNELQTIFVPKSVERIDVGSIYLVDLYFESAKLLKEHNLSDDFLTIHLNTSLEAYQSIISMWEDTDK